MISVGSEARSAGVSKKIASAAAAVIVGLAGLTFSAAAEPPLSNSEAAPQIAQARATCRTPEVEARIQELTKEIAAREPQDEGARKVITSLVINGNPISTNSDLYRRYYNHLQSSQQ